ncbi:hypothetical protein L218DRAFT_938523 [Marasmius fiardii PR-910]|nr:hypothetical protein L218DRAFT_938523 [Marasmius fiardii PR-910]
MITLYDFGPSYFDKSMGTSPFVRIIRFALNLKKIPYRVVELGLFDLTPTAKSIGAPPTGTKPDGTPKYTVPFIQDDSTGAVVSESFLIAMYLDSAYPNTPRIVPDGGQVVQSTFCRYVFKSFDPILPVVRSITERDFESDGFLTPEFIAGQRRVLGDAIIDVKVSPDDESGAWKAVRASFDSLGEAYGGQKSPFVMGGDGPTVADFTVVGFLWLIYLTYGEECKQWKEVCSWSGGRIGVLCSEVVSKCRREEP